MAIRCSPLSPYKYFVIYWIHPTYFNSTGEISQTTKLSSVRQYVKERRQLYRPNSCCCENFQLPWQRQGDVTDRREREMAVVVARRRRRWRSRRSSSAAPAWRRAVTSSCHVTSSHIWCDVSRRTSVSRCLPLNTTVSLRPRRCAAEPNEASNGPTRRGRAEQFDERRPKCHRVTSVVAAGVGGGAWSS